MIFRLFLLFILIKSNLIVQSIEGLSDFSLNPTVCCSSQEPVQILPIFVLKIVPTFTPIPLLPQVNRHRNFYLLSNAICGTREEQQTSQHLAIQNRILGGEKTGLLEFPWMALLFYTTFHTGQLVFRCGGSVITNRYVLTAAHCITNLSPRYSLSFVRLGEHDLRSNPDCDEHSMSCAEPYQEFMVEEIWPHPDFAPEARQNDIGLVRVVGFIDFHPRGVRPICLPPQGQQVPSELITTGWGATEDLPLSPKLLKVNLAVISNDDCRKHYNITYTHMCAGRGQGRDSCKGDSGGPLQGLDGERHRVIQFGIVSYGLTKCGTRGFPGVYTKVSYYVDWILDNIRH